MNSPSMQMKILPAFDTIYTVNEWLMVWCHLVGCDIWEAVYVSQASFIQWFAMSKIDDVARSNN